MGIASRSRVRRDLATKLATTSFTPVGNEADLVVICA
jgi:hypothetical protein